MSFIEILLIALGLSMDSFAVSVTSGTILGKIQVRHFFRIALYMGFFQGFMPLLGWLAGVSFLNYIENYDHWIAFALLAVIGGKMVYEGFAEEKEEGESKCFDPTRALTLLGLAVATSIDALAVGVSFAMLRIDLIEAILLISLVTFLISFLGTYLGAKVGKRLNMRIEVWGGIILIGIGLKILIEHLFC